MARKVQEINAGSMADIAFLLLIFFLMTTTMDIDSGITRKLPSPSQEPVDTKVRERNVYIVLLNTYNQLFVESAVMDVKDLCQGVKEFIANPNNKENLSERNKDKPIEVPNAGTMYPSKGVVSLQNDRNTSYEKYIEVQNELVRAFNELRDEFSRQRWGIAFEDLDEDRQKAVKDLFPQSISEATPRNVEIN